MNECSAYPRVHEGRLGLDQQFPLTRPVATYGGPDPWQPEVTRP